jgi:hypothetical protein
MLVKLIEFADRVKWPVVGRRDTEMTGLGVYRDLNVPGRQFLQDGLDRDPAGAAGRKIAAPPNQ